MTAEKWKTSAYSFGAGWRCGNCGSRVEELCYSKQLIECHECHWLVSYAQSTGPTTTPNEI